MKMQNQDRLKKDGFTEMIWLDKAGDELHIWRHPNKMTGRTVFGMWPRWDSFPYIITLPFDFPDGFKLIEVEEKD